jgi:hypothetical protein
LGGTFFYSCNPYVSSFWQQLPQRHSPRRRLISRFFPKGAAVECDDILEIEVFEQYLKRFPAIRKPETGRILWH